MRSHVHVLSVCTKKIKKCREDAGDAPDRPLGRGEGTRESRRVCRGMCVCVCKGEEEARPLLWNSAKLFARSTGPVEKCLIWSFARGDANKRGEIAAFRDSVRTGSCSVSLPVSLR